MVFFCPVRSDRTGNEWTKPFAARNALFIPAGLPPMSAKGRSAPLGRKIDGGETMAELGVTNLAVTRGLDHGPSVGIGEQRLEHEGVQAMAAATGMIGAEDGRAGKGEVADRVEGLVAHEL